MYNQSEAILQQYDLEIKQISRGRGAYICETNEGTKLLTPFRGSKERAMFLKDVLRRLDESGVAAEQIMLTKEGEAVATDESGMRYWLKDMVYGAECSTNREQDMVRAVTSLGKLHCALKTCASEIPAFMKTDRNDPENVCRRHYREQGQKLCAGEAEQKGIRAPFSDTVCTLYGGRDGGSPHSG